MGVDYWEDRRRGRRRRRRMQDGKRRERLDGRKATRGFLQFEIGS